MQAQHARRPRSGAAGLQRLQSHMDDEDRRVKELTESILYDFLPAALNVVLPWIIEDPLQELKPDECRGVAAAALSVAALMNAPPGFLEFLLCVPWQKLPLLRASPPQCSPFDQLRALCTPEEPERVALVNSRITPALMPAILDFIYRPEHVTSLPPLLRPRTTLQDGGEPPLAANGLPTTHAGGQQQQQQQQQRLEAAAALAEVAAALLDGATALHCGALRGNPAQVDHLLYCGADPTLRTAAGELAIEMVPACGRKEPGAGAAPPACRCMSGREQEVWECRSALARSLLARRTFFSFTPALGAWRWLQLVLLCLLCCLGLAPAQPAPGSHLRPAVAQHTARLREARRKEREAHAAELQQRLRDQAGRGAIHLALAKQAFRKQRGAHDPGGPTDGQQAGCSSPGKAHSSDGGPSDHPPGIHPSSSSCCTGGGGSSSSSAGGWQTQGRPGETPHGVDGVVQPASDVMSNGQHMGSCHGAPVDGGGSGPAEEAAAQAEELSTKALSNFVHAVHALQSLEAAASGGSSSSSGSPIANGWASTQAAPAVAAAAEAASPGLATAAVPEFEQANLYAGWAQAVLLKFRCCACPGCAAVAMQAARIAHVQTARLLAKVAASAQCTQSQRLLMGSAHARALYCHIDIVLDTDASHPPTRAAVWRAEQCLKEWEQLQQSGMAAAVQEEQAFWRPASGSSSAAKELAAWVQAADADLYIAEALLGSPLGPNQPLDEVIAKSITALADGSPQLARPISPEVVQQLEDAITLACMPSAKVGSLAKAVAANAAAQLAAAAQLQDVLQQGTSATTPPGEMLHHLGAAVAAAQRFPSLAADLEAARAMQGRWAKRAEAVNKLDAIVDGIKLHAMLEAPSATDSTAAAAQGPHDGPSAASAAAGASPEARVSLIRADGSTVWFDLGAAQAQIQLVEAAIAEAREAAISVMKAKRVVKELTAQVAAAEAAQQLDTLLARKPCGSGQLKAGLSKAESAAGALAGLASLQEFGELLLPKLAAGRKRLDVERAAEALSREARGAKAVSDLPRLETAILNARKVGAEELDPEAYRSASELRSRLLEASKVRASLEAATKALQRSGRVEEADALEHAAEEAAAQWEALLGPEIRAAREAAAHCRALSASEARLQRVLREGAGIAQLSRAIQEAAATGVNVAPAKRILKAMQGLEAALGSASTSGETASQYAQLKAKVEAADAAGVTHPMLASARKVLHKLRLAEAQAALEAALKLRSDWSVIQRISSIKAALEQAEGVVGAMRLEQAAASAAAAEAEETMRAAPAGESQQAEQGVAPGANGRRSSTGGSADANATVSPAHAGSPDAASGTLASATASTDSADAPLPGEPGGATKKGLGLGEEPPAPGDGSAAQHGGGDSVEEQDEAVPELLLELVRRARGVLREDQAELARLEAERAEQEAARRAQLERARQAREAAEKERAERDKAEAAERARLAAERRAAAERDRSRLIAAERKPRPTAAQPSAMKGSSSASLAGAATAAGPRPILPPPPPPPRAARLGPAAAARQPGYAPSSVAGLLATQAVLSAEQPFLMASQPPQGLGLAGPMHSMRSTHGTTQHARGDSFDILEDASAKLKRELLEALDLDGHSDSESHSPPLQRPQPGTSAAGLLQTASSSEGAGRGLAEVAPGASSPASVSVEGSGPSFDLPGWEADGAGDGLSSGLGSRFGFGRYVDLGGASWGLDAGSVAGGGATGGLAGPTSVAGPCSTALFSGLGGMAGPAGYGSGLLGPPGSAPNGAAGADAASRAAAASSAMAGGGMHPAGGGSGGGGLWHPHQAAGLHGAYGMVDMGGMDMGEAEATALQGLGGPLEQGARGSGGGRICRFFLQGYCREGEACHFAHVMLPPGSAVLTGVHPYDAAVVQNNGLFVPPAASGGMMVAAPAGAMAYTTTAAASSAAQAPAFHPAAGYQAAPSSAFAINASGSMLPLAAALPSPSKAQPSEAALHRALQVQPPAQQHAADGGVDVFDTAPSSPVGGEQAHPGLHLPHDLADSLPNTVFPGASAIIAADPVDA